MKYFIVANSFAAPFFSDTSTDFIVADSAKEALEKFVQKYNHPFGLYSAGCFKFSDEYHEGKGPIASWRCNLVLEMENATKGKGSCSICHDNYDTFTVDGVSHKVKDPKSGSVTVWVKE